MSVAVSSGFSNESNVIECTFVCQTHEVIAVHCHPHIQICIEKLCCTVSASSESAQLSADQVYRVKLPSAQSILCTIQPLDQPANVLFSIRPSIFRWKTNTYESLGRSWRCALLMSWCHNFRGLPLLDPPTDIMIETITFAASRGGIAEHH